ncbi:MFS transporter [Sphingomonas panacisoli]|uniref:MFS transporter n=2 Tax=Sphingomonas panacisoli TaxID=1813879 RepID=A0A5B8LLC6_9SPHN|nr:MFS transporter [Sphingomonas panacisoli]
MAIGFTAMQSFGVVQEGAKIELKLSDQVLGMIQGLGAAVPLVIFSIPVGILVDRYNRVRLMTLLGVVWTIGTLLTALAPDIGVLIAGRMLTGIGTTGALTCALSLCADLCAPEQRGRALLIVNLGKSAGLAAAFVLAGWLFGLFASHGGPALLDAWAPWRSTHIALAAFSAVLLTPLLLMREPQRHEVESSTTAPFRVVARELWSRRAFLGPLFAGQVAVVMADAAAGVWVAPVLSRNYGLQPQQFGGWVGAILFVSGIVGAALGGVSADIGQRSRIRGGLLIGATIAAGVGIPAALFPIMPSVPTFAIAFFVLMASGAVTGLVVSVALTVLIPNELRGLCIGAFIALAGLIGFGLAPWLVSVVSSALGGEQHLAMALTIVGAGVGALSFCAFALAMRRAPQSAMEEPV